MMTNENGKIGLAPMRSPEYNGDDNYKNSNYNLANLKWLLTTLINVSETGKLNTFTLPDGKTH